MGWSIFSQVGLSNLGFLLKIIIILLIWVPQGKKLADVLGIKEKMGWCVIDAGDDFWSQSAPGSDTLQLIVSTAIY
jgi:hypothetical protein